MKYQARWSERAVADLRGLGRAAADRVTRKVSWFCSQSDPMRFAKTLGGAWKDVYRFRVGDYRVLFEKSAGGEVHILMILRVQHRREVYEN
jgi:mRNA-degrading endonuclease RelE of RelBE toxin-antitoxin system